MSLLDRDLWLLQWRELHGGIEPSGLVRGWLALVYRLARPLARAGVHPNALTLGSLVAAGCVLLVPAWAGLLLVLLSAMLDGVDGSVAVLQHRATRVGYVLDSAVDRCCDALFLVALVQVGGPVELAAACGFAVFLLEYVRARAGEVGTITVAERPTRVILTLLGLGLGWGSWALWSLLVVTAVGLVQLTWSLRTDLR